MDPGILTVLGLAMLPAVGNIGGGVLAEWLNPGERTLNRALHAAAGVMLAVVAVEVMPEALGSTPAWLLAPFFLAGGLAYLLAEKGLQRWQETRPAGAGAGAWMIYLGVTADLLGDGLLIGAGTAVSTRLALLLALGQVLADIPEGFAVIANFRHRGLAVRTRMLLSASFLLPVVGAALFAYFVLRGQDESVKMLGLVFAAGLYTLAAVEDMLHEAHEAVEDSRWSAVSFLVGFTLFLALSGGFG